MAVGSKSITVPQSGGVPEDYLVSGAAAIDILAVKADFDGTSAAVDFVPVVQFLNEAGEVMAQSVGSKITAGDTATVTFAPFLEVAQTSSGGGGIQFDTFNVGDWLSIETLDTLSNGISIRNDGDGGIALRDDGAAGILVRAGGGDLDLEGQTAQLDATSGNLTLSASTGEIDVVGDDPVIVKATGGQLFLESAGNFEAKADTGHAFIHADGDVVLTSNDQGAASGVNTVINLGSGEFIVAGFNPTTPLLKVIYDSGTDTATYHIRTGAAWVADL